MIKVREPRYLLEYFQPDVTVLVLDTGMADSRPATQTYGVYIPVAHAAARDGDPLALADVLYRQAERTYFKDTGKIVGFTITREIVQSGLEAIAKLP